MASRAIPELSVKHLRAIVALAQSGKFTAAAAGLGISQPGLSRVIRQAERQLEVALFARGTRSVALTAAGRAFVPVADRLLGELVQQTERIRTLDGELRGQLIIASLMSISHQLLPAALVTFRRRHPNMHIQIREGLASGVLEDVRSGFADFGIGNPPVRHPEIAVHSISQERCYVVIPRDHALAGRSVISLKDLADEPLVSMPSNAGLRKDIDAAAHAASVSLNHSIVTNQYPTLFDFVAKGLGISIVPVSALPPPRRYGILLRALRPTIVRRVGILHLADRPLSAASIGFLDIFRPMFQAALRIIPGRKIDPRT